MLMRCYLCGNDKFSPRRGRVRDDPAMEVLECSKCGLVFLSSFAHITPDHYRNSGMHGKDLAPVSDWLKETEADDERRFRFLLPNLPGKKVLDFGCGAGGFLLKVRDHADRVLGIELELRLQDHFQETGLSVFTSLEDCLSSGEKFDLITAFHVIEHLPDPREILVKLKNMLSDEGELVIEVPNPDDALLTIYECGPFMDFTYWSQHLYLFNLKTLSDLIRQSGLELRWSRHIQRYPLSNHLFWLSKGRPGGHKIWSFLDSEELNGSYAAQLASLGCTDTILVGAGKDEKRSCA